MKDKYIYFYYQTDINDIKGLPDFLTTNFNKLLKVIENDLKKEDIEIKENSKCKTFNELKKYCNECYIQSDKIALLARCLNHCYIGLWNDANN